jgi:hypothetical protein
LSELLPDSLAAGPRFQAPNNARAFVSTASTLTSPTTIRVAFPASNVAS